MLHSFFSKRVFIFCKDGHSGPVNSVCFDENGNFLLSGGHDCRIKLWDLNNNKRLVQSYDVGHLGAIYWYVSFLFVIFTDSDSQRFFM
jgi:WD40 repeat protein